VQKAVNGVVKEQTQPLAHGWVALQEPPQVVEPLAPLCNCRAETVPAQRTPMTSAVKNIDLIFFMISCLLLRTEHSRTNITSYFPGLAATKLHVPDVNPG
jgi:hypothetical protein